TADVVRTVLKFDVSSAYAPGMTLCFERNSPMTASVPVKHNMRRLSDTVINQSRNDLIMKPDVKKFIDA
ncbi:hypothetical protein, partial [Klebsiella pneumoniae]|uniref:hypothetical protein n=1 Tax=Klebsiella pneumoniae TaxID=573 RepID=UPI002242CA57